jgi:hypothetical protein
MAREKATTVRRRVGEPRWSERSMTIQSSRPVLNAVKDRSSTGEHPSKVRMREARTLNRELPIMQRLISFTPQARRKITVARE